MLALSALGVLDGPARGVHDAAAADDALPRPREVAVIREDDEDGRDRLRSRDAEDDGRMSLAFAARRARRRCRAPRGRNGYG